MSLTSTLVIMTSQLHVSLSRPLDIPGYQLHVGTRCESFDITSSDGSLDQCKQKCDANINCKSFYYHSKTPDCKIKSQQCPDKDLGAVVLYDKIGEVMYGIM